MLYNKTLMTAPSGNIFFWFPSNLKLSIKILEKQNRCFPRMAVASGGGGGGGGGPPPQKILKKNFKMWKKNLKSEE